MCWVAYWVRMRKYTFEVAHILRFINVALFHVISP